jgi:hypothetical protein
VAGSDGDGGCGTGVRFLRFIWERKRGRRAEKLLARSGGMVSLLWSGVVHSGAKVASFSSRMLCLSLRCCQTCLLVDCMSILRKA